jgi:hypothetical protein
MGGSQPHSEGVQMRRKVNGKSFDGDLFLNDSCIENLIAPTGRKAVFLTSMATLHFWDDRIVGHGTSSKVK